MSSNEEGSQSKADESKACELGEVDCKNLLFFPVSYWQFFSSKILSEKPNISTSNTIIVLFSKLYYVLCYPIATYIPDRKPSQIGALAE